MSLIEDFLGAILGIDDGPVPANPGMTEAVQDNENVSAPETSEALNGGSNPNDVLLENLSVEMLDVTGIFEGFTNSVELIGDPSTYFGQLFDEQTQSLRKPETFRYFEHAAMGKPSFETPELYERFSNLISEPHETGILGATLQTLDSNGISASHRGLISGVLSAAPTFENTLIEQFERAGVTPRVARLAGFGSAVVLIDAAIHALTADSVAVHSLTETIVNAVSMDAVEHTVALAVVIGLGNAMSVPGSNVSLGTLASIVERIIRARSR
jgi:hypothetical protein